MGIAYNPRIVTDGLVLSLDANNRKSYPGIGTTWTDLSGSRNTGTLVNGVQYSFNFANGGSLVFDGTNDYVDCGSSSVLSISNNLTISIWFRFPVGYGNTGGDGWNSILAKRPSAGSANYGINYNPTEMNLFQWYYLGNGGGILSVPLTSNFSENVWTNVCGVFSQNSATTDAFLYKNGSLLTSANLIGNIPSISAEFTIGCYGSSGFGFYELSPITVAQVSIYNRALTASEVLQNYNALKGRFSTQPSIVTEGLVLNLDAGDENSYDKYENLIIYSEEINNWANNGNAISISPNSQIAPDGTLTADVLSQTAVTGAGRWVSSFNNTGNFNYPTYTAGETYTISVWLKKVSGTDSQPSIGLWVYNGEAGQSLINQSVGTLTTEWVRYSATFTPSTTISVNTFTGLNIGWNVDGAENNFTFAAWGFQMERAGSATDYYKTTIPGTAKTRGTTWIDLTGNGNNGTLTNGPTYNSSNGGSIVFDGTNDYITIPNGNYLNTNSFTVSLWMYLDNITTTFTDYCFLDKNVYNTSGISAALGTGGELGNRILYVRYGTTDNADSDFSIVPSASLVTFDAWHNVTLVFTYNAPNSQILAYIDGVYSGATIPVSGTFVSNTNALNIGSPGPGNGVHHKGKISSYQIYNRALTVDEIQNNFDVTRSRYGI